MTYSIYLYLAGMGIAAASLDQISKKDISPLTYSPLVDTLCSHLYSLFYDAKNAATHQIPVVSVAVWVRKMQEMVFITKKTT